MAASLGAHEVMEVHEILTCAIDAVNQFQLYRPHVKDAQLQQILEHQLQFMTNEYNGMVGMLQQKGMNQPIPYRTMKTMGSPVYGLRQPAPQSPNQSANELDDRDVASGMLGCHKASASMRMIGALECADPNLRSALQQGAINCSEQAYEVWQYMNEKGYYQVPTLKEVTMNTVLNTYTRGGGMSAGAGAGMQPGQMQQSGPPMHQSGQMQQSGPIQQSGQMQQSGPMQQPGQTQQPGQIQ